MKRLTLHILFWLMFFFIWKRIAYFYISNDRMQLLFTVLDVASIILPFYIIFLLVAPRFFIGSKKMLFVFAFTATSFISAYFLTSTMNYALDKSLFNIRFDINWTFEGLVFNRYLIVFLAGIAGLITKLSFDWIRNQKKIVLLEQENIKAELDSLKSQINPHFLFNILNTIYVQTEIAPLKAQYSIHNLSQLLRYQLYECNTDKVLLEKEVAYLEDYISLQKIRLENSVTVYFKKNLDNNSNYIAPLILINFIENAFKHFCMNDDGKMITIELRVANNQLNFIVKNSKSPIKNNERLTGGVGLINVKRRLELLYPQNHSLTIDDKGFLYSVELVINLFS